jgi:phage RecT family recombinase
MAQTQTQTQTLAQPQQQAPAQQQPRQNLAERFHADLDAYTPNLKDALPADIPVERFKRVLITAVSTNPDLLYADRRSLFNAAMRCAVDGLIPDGRQAALVTFRTDVKTRDPQTGIDHVRKMDVATYMPMLAGLRERMRKSGEVASAVAEAVFERDVFSYRLGDDPYIEHRPPPLGEPRGQVIGAYAIIRLKNGEVIRDVMDRPMIEAARNVSRAKNSPMWTNFYWEGAKKSVLRRASKQAPFSSELRRVIDRDDEAPEIGPDATPGLLARQPEPQREHYHIGNGGSPTGPEFAIVDLDGVESIYASAGAAYEAMLICLDEAARIGAERLEGWFESNQHAVQFLHAAGYADLASDVTRAYEQAKQPKPAGSSSPTDQQGAPGPAAQSRARAEPDRGSSVVEEEGYPGSLVPRRTRQTRPRETPATAAPAEEQAPHAPPAGEADPFGLEEVDHRMPPTEEPPPADSRRPELEIVVPMKGGKRDWRTWALALLGPKVRRCATSNELADLLGANEQNLEEARAALAATDRAEMERVIAEQWQKLPT